MAYALIPQAVKPPITDIEPIIPAANKIPGGPPPTPPTAQMDYIADRVLPYAMPVTNPAD